MIDMASLVSGLFRTSWKPLHSDDCHDAALQNPGIYLLTLSGRSLSGRPVQVDDVYYVRMEAVCGPG